MKKLIFFLQDLRGVKLQLAFVKEENDRLRNDLADLTKLSEMLNVKFKLMSHEKEKLKEQSEEFTFSFQDARDPVSYTHLTLPTIYSV